ncbi:MAG: YgeY family selenium metabolism-linked hydrolase, partial [Caldilineaceae bacterium]|nr:YgeY family selenium metabolism-linked hydrolase [Caldilineaceae bacterium]
MDDHRLITFAQDLVRLPSPSGRERAVAERVQEEMQALGFDRVWMDEYGSVVGIVEGAWPGKTVLLDAHTDTVGISPGVPWVHDPFAATIEN